MKVLAAIVFVLSLPSLSASAAEPASGVSEGAALTGATLDRASFDRMMHYVGDQLAKMSPTAAVTGAAAKTKGLSRDELQWVSGETPKEGALQSPNPKRILLALHPRETGSRILDLGLQREPAGEAKGKTTWAVMVADVAGLEVRYYDSRLGSWLERWNDLSVHPARVRIRVWGTEKATPLEAILELPKAPE